MATFHYVPLHSSKAGEKFGEFRGIDKYTTIESEKLVRLPLYYDMAPQELELVVSAVMGFYKSETFLPKSIDTLATNQRC